MTLYVIAFIIICTISTVSPNCTSKKKEMEAASYMRKLNDKYAMRFKRISEAEWQYSINITTYNQNNQISVETEAANEEKADWLETIKFNWKSFSDPKLRRQFKKYSILGVSALPTEKFQKLTSTIADMVTIYSTVKLCDYNNRSKCDLELEPELTNIFATSRDPNELKYYWLEWRKAIGPKVKDKYELYVKLSNEAAILNNFTDNAAFWLKDYESDDIRDQFHNLWEQLKPLYLQIHAYVRYKLRQKYGDVVSQNGPIPAHLLGNMWAQDWTYVADFSLPYPDATGSTVTEEMIKQEYTPNKIFRTANDFYMSINLTAMPQSFWNKSILEKPTDGRELVCHPSASDFFDNDVRIKMCTQVNEEYFYIAHHEMGHTEYYLQYSKQPAIFRDGANPGFHEAIGDTVTLSVKSKKHLHKIGLSKEALPNEKTLLNDLYTTGLDKIVFLPFGYLMDLWRWDVFSNKISKDEWNCKWWQLRHEYQGVEPPVNRTEDDFDPAGKYHIVADSPYISYFVSFVIQFQFYRSLCLTAGEYDPNDPKKPLHNCDIYQNTKAGNMFGQMLRMGASKPWPDAMKVVTGHRYMDASALLEYFMPLRKWLEEENHKNGVFIGWEPTRKVCSSTRKQL